MQNHVDIYTIWDINMPEIKALTQCAKLQVDLALALESY